METLQETVTYREDTGAATKPTDKNLYDSMAQQDESNYVDLNGLGDIKEEGAKTIKVTFTGEGNRPAIFRRNSNSQSTSEDQTPGDRDLNDDAADLPAANCRSITEKDVGGDKADDIIRDTTGSFGASSSCEMPDKSFKGCLELSTENRDAVPGSQIVPRKFNPEMGSINKEELQYSDMYISRKSDPVGGVGVVLSYHRMPSVTDDESHYITTHEIQLSELDHDTDYDFETESCWDIEDNNLACSFIDYASFDSEEKLDARRERSLARVKSNQVHANNTDRRGTGGAAVSTKPENDLCDTNKRVSSDESLSKNQNGSGNCAGQIHLSIKATSRAINEPSDVQGKENIRCYAKHQGDMSRHVFRRGDTKAEKICDSAKCFIAAPRRLHFGTKIKGKDINEYSSGASSAVSELDDADKEVRNLTARAFRSLACPYFDAINFSTSSESSASEHGLGINRWSAFVDLKYDMTRAREKNLVSHKSATSTFEIDKNAGKAIKGLPLADIKAPQTKIFALNGNLPDPKNASSSTKKMELMGTFGKGRRGVITLTETLNFRCNVQAGVPGGERRAKFAQNATGSRSGDEVTCALPSRRGEAIRQPCNAGVSMEGAHKKAIFATSLLKNVISKKMQFEQERKMERGEICEPPPALSPYFFFKDHETHKEKRGDGARSVQRQTSKFSEAGSDLTVVCLDELADLADNNLCDPKDDSQREDTLTLASETNLEPTNEAGFNTKKGAFEASKSTLLRSQNSAFRSWKDGEQHFEKEHKNDKTPAGKPHSSTGKLGKTDVEIEVGGSRLTKMSHLFVPSIHIMPEERATGNQPVNMKYSSRPAAHEAEEDAKVRSNSTLYVADTARSVVTSKSPEIKISLRSVKDSKGNPFNIAKLLTPNIGCNATSLIKTADDSKCQAQAVSLKGDAAEKVPHFMVRDIRDNKSKLQTPIHQVRDVRKLVKSSYHFVPSDANEFKTAAASDLLAEHNLSIPGPSRNPSSVSPIVIKCQSVNTNSNVKRSGNLIEVPKRRPADNITETERLSPQAQTEGANSGPILVHPSTSRAALATKLLNGDPSELPVEGKSEFVSAKRKLDKTTDTSEKKPESKMANQAALEKLQAAVKTMEQLYVFDRNEWKRKSEPQPIMDSHVLSLIASEEHEVKTELEEEDTGNAGSTEADVHSKHLLRSDSYSDVERSLASMSATELLREDREQLKMLHIPFSWEDKDAPRSQSLQSEAFGSKNAFTFTHSQKPAASRGSTRRSQACPSSQTPFSTKTIAPKAAKETTPIKISHPKGTVAKREKHNNNEAENSVLANMSIMSNSENYLTIPVKSHPGDGKPAAAPMREQAVYTFTAARGQARAGSPSSQGGSQSNASRCDSSSQSPKRSTVVMEARSADTPTATIYHHSIPMAQPQVICFSSPPVPPTSSDPFQPTQRKMLLDPTTGHYYLVDTPIQPATRRLFDPETGQYVDVPMPQPPVAPLPMPMPPLALNPATYGPAYMIYPSFLPGPPVMPARPAPTLSVCTESEDGDGASVKTPQGDVAYLEGPYYIPTGKALQSQHVTTRGTKGVTNNKPIISITSQQGPRIIAPPSFDGTTMSFVVEHR